MRILYLTMYFSESGQNLYNNLVDALIERGHNVTVARAVSGDFDNESEKINDNLSLLNVKASDLFCSNKVKKALNQMSLSALFKKAVKKNLRDESFDLILYATPPVTLAGAVKFCKRTFGAKAFLMLKDIFPQNAVDLGMMKEGSFIYKYFRKQEKDYYRFSDYIGCMSQGNADYVIKYNPDIEKSKLHVFANSIAITDDCDTEFHEDKTVFFFGGNLGKPQNFPFLLSVIKKMADYPKAEFVIMGTGTEKEKIKEFYSENNLPNFTFREYMPQKEYEKVLAGADVGLISLDPRFTIPNIPSKFQTYLKLRKPVLAVTDVNTDLRNMIAESDCGWWCDASDKESVVKTIKEICDSKELQKEKGKNGFVYLKKKFDVNDNVTKIEKFMNERQQRMKNQERR